MEEIQHLSQAFWDERYQQQQTGWDLGMVSPPIQSYFEKVENKHARILIPGAGNAYEAEHLLQEGFTDITIIDIAPSLVAILNEKYKDNESIKIIHGNFFELNDTFDIVVEQTFFCAISPSLRKNYVEKMHQILADKGYIVGLLFDKEFESGPPYSGSKMEYENLFNNLFELNRLEACRNSVKPRAGAELFVKLIKK